MKRYKLKKWVKVTIISLLIIILGIIIYQFLTVEKNYQTPVGNYTCKGRIVRVCSGSEEVANYLGE